MMRSNFFDKLNEAIRDIESSVVNFISAIAPWLAPLSPAYMTYEHAVNTLRFPQWVALPVALVVEILGFSTISTFMTFWFFNRRNKAESKQAPIGLVVIAFLFYLALIVTANVLLDTFDNARGAVIAVRALFALQTIPAALIVVVRAGHRAMLADLAKEKEERRAESSRKVTEDERKDAGKFPADWRRVRKLLTPEQIKEIATGKGGEIAYKYGVSERTARNWREYAQKDVAR
jgi:hypothetical protein